MERQIPIYFDSVVISSPITQISDDVPNISRLKVRVFTKYANRNGSYITENVANQLIDSATNQMTPVVGFFDPQTQSWASHTGPTLANAYGYVEDFLGWEPFQDTDGITRDYAVFSVILFTDYYEEAKKIAGQNQSMELNPESIQGDWALIDDKEYFVYTTAKMLGFCVIGEHEPCFSVSSFFAKNDGIYDSQADKFASLLYALKSQVEAISNTENGGEQLMNELEVQEVVENVETEVSVEEEETTQENENFELETNQEETEEVKEEEETTVEETVEEESVEPEESQPTEFELLQEQFNALQTSYNELNAQFAELQQQANDTAAKDTEIASLREQVQNLQNIINNYQKAEETAKKNILIEKYEKVMEGEEISSIKAEANDLSYDELESRLAIQFANQKIAGSEQKFVPLSEPAESQFSLLMKKYRKN